MRPQIPRIKTYMQLRRALILGFSLLSLILYPGNVLFSEKFQGPISPKEKRIKDFKEELNENKQDLPEEYHLFFQELKGNYAIFYDLDGHTVHFQYRRNKWDREAIESVHNLLSGRSYKVSGDFLGVNYYPSVKESRSSILPLFIAKKDVDLRTKKDLNTVPIYKLKAYNESYSDAILLQTPDE